METTLVFDNGIYYMKRNNFILNCPYISRVLIPDRNALTGEIKGTPNSHPCSSLCPHFNVTNQLPGQVVELCNNTKIKITK